MKPAKGNREMNVVFFKDGYAICAINGRLFETCQLNVGKHVHVDDTPMRGLDAKYPQLCNHGARIGAVLTYYNDRQFAAALNARICHEWQQFVQNAGVTEHQWSNVSAEVEL